MRRYLSHPSIKCTFVVLVIRTANFASRKESFCLSFAQCARWPYKLCPYETLRTSERTQYIQPTINGAGKTKTPAVISATYTLTKNTAIYHSSGYPWRNPVASHFTDLSLSFSRVSRLLRFPGSCRPIFPVYIVGKHQIKHARVKRAHTLWKTFIQSEARARQNITIFASRVCVFFYILTTLKYLYEKHLCGKRVCGWLSRENVVIKSFMLIIEYFARLRKQFRHARFYGRGSHVWKSVKTTACVFVRTKNSCSISLEPRGARSPCECCSR